MTKMWFERADKIDFVQNVLDLDSECLKTPTPTFCELFKKYSHLSCLSLFLDTLQLS